MMAPLFLSPWCRPLGDSGEIMPGAKLRFFSSETTDPEDVYADGNLNTSLGNEVEADAAGRFPSFYLDPTVVYRVQLLDSNDVLQSNGDVDPLFPVTGSWVGEVRMHDGPLEDVPAGWVVCDGTGGTIDTRDRHPRGVGSGTTLGETGGSSTASGTTTAAGGHNHGGTTDGHALTEAENGQHAHTFLAADNAGDSNADGWLSTNDMGIPGEDVGPFVQRLENEGSTQIIADSGDGTPHAHGIGSVADHTHDVNGISIEPPFFGIYFIKFVGA